MKTRTILIMIFILVIIDQIIKIIVNEYFLDLNLEIVTSLLEFRPKYNDKHSYVNVLLSNNTKVYLGVWFHIAFFLIYQVLILIIYDFVRSKIKGRTKSIDLSITLQVSAMICALIGNLIWENGTLDYLYLKPLFIFDLKDFYNSCFIVLFLLTLFLNWGIFKNLELRDIVFHVRNKFQF